MSRILSVLILFFILTTGLTMPVLANELSAVQACTPSEKWNFSELKMVSLGLSGAVQSEFQAFLYRKIQPVHIFTTALSLRNGHSPEILRLFGEYWVSRSLFEAGLIHFAHRGFRVLVSYPISQQTAGVQLAALECLNRIAKRFPTLPQPEAIYSQLLKLGQLYPKNGAVMEAAIVLLKKQLSVRASSAEIQKTLLILKNGGAREALAKGWVAAAQHRHAEVILELEHYLKESMQMETRPWYLDQVLLLLSRSHFTLGNFERGISLLKQIRKSSNELTKSLSELAWHQLLRGHYADSIGTGLNLESGLLRKTFSPESLMVMAMALNEICQFPESIRAIRLFKKNYEASYQWLENWFDQKPSLYSHAVQYLQFRGDAPVRVASEWIRSPVFIANQDEINLFTEEIKLSAALSQAGAHEEWELVQRIRNLARKLTPQIKQVRSILQPWEPLPPPLRKSVLALRAELDRFKRFRVAAPLWRLMQERHQKLTPLLIREKIEIINEDLKRRSIKMLHQLEEVVENNQLVEVEIYQGASEDIIWQNAYPDYKEVAKKLKKEEAQSVRGKVWDWGQRTAIADEENEIWEDELGSFKANLVNNCSSKQKYLALKNQLNP